MIEMFISKYALSAGITSHNCSPPDEKGMVYPGEPFMKFYGFKIGVDIHINKDDAIKAADEMRIKKIASLEKQIKKLKSLNFNNY